MSYEAVIDAGGTTCLPNGSENINSIPDRCVCSTAGVVEATFAGTTNAEFAAGGDDWQGRARVSAVRLTLFRKGHTPCLVFLLALTSTSAR